MTSLVFRPETEADHAAIHRLTADAFAPMRFSDGTEPAIIRQLRARNELVLSLAAVQDGALVAHVAFSPARIADQPGYLVLGPLSVAPPLQRRGIGSALVADAIGRLRASGAKGVVVIGNPAVYGPMGFVGDCGLTCGDLAPALVQYMPLIAPAPVPSGEVIFSPAFG